MNPETIEKLYKLLEEIPVTAANRPQLRNIKELLDNNDFEAAMANLQNLKYDLSEDPEFSEISDKFPKKEEPEEEEFLEEEESAFPKELMDEELEETYIGLLLEDPRSISRYYFLHEDCFFADDTISNLYRLVLFADGESYASELAKRNFNFAKNIEEIFPLKQVYKGKVKGKKYDFEKIYVELRKLFILRKNFRRIPIKNIQDKIVDIINYKLYNEMSIEEVESAITQAEITSKFKSSVLNEDVSNFLTSGSNNLSNRTRTTLPYFIKCF